MIEIMKNIPIARRGFLAGCLALITIPTFKKPKAWRFIVQTTVADGSKWERTFVCDPYTGVKPIGEVVKSKGE